MTELSSDLTHTFPRLLQERALREIEVRSLTHETLADKLDIFPEGARRIMSNKEWPASLGLRVLEALDLKVDIQFPDRSDS